MAVASRYGNDADEADEQLRRNGPVRHPSSRASSAAASEKITSKTSAPWR